MTYQTRFVRSEHIHELVNLYHLGRTALAGEQDRGRWARKNWAAKEFARSHPYVSINGAYKDLDGLLSI